MKKTKPEYYPPVENLLDLIYEHYTENNPVEKNTVAGKVAKEKEKELEEWMRGLDGMDRLADDYVGDAIGVVQPVGVSVECFGTEHQSLDFIEAYIHDSYDLTPQGIIKRLGLLDVDYNKVSAYGHFGKAGLPWEE